MAYEGAGHYKRVNHYSNPNVLYNNNPTGVEGISNNARLITANRYSGLSYYSYMSPSSDLPWHPVELKSPMVNVMTALLTQPMSHAVGQIKI